MRHLICFVEIPILQMESSSYTGQVGASVTLGCTVSAATPSVTEIFWRKLINGVYTRITIDNVRFFGSSTSNANLTITNLALSDATSYQCSAVNAAGTGYSGATTLSVTGSMFIISHLSTGKKNCLDKMMLNVVLLKLKYMKCHFVSHFSHFSHLSCALS